MVKVELVMGLFLYKVSQGVEHLLEVMQIAQVELLVVEEAIQAVMVVVGGAVELLFGGN